MCVVKHIWSEFILGLQRWLCCQIPPESLGCPRSIPAILSLLGLVLRHHTWGLPLPWIGNWFQHQTLWCFLWLCYFPFLGSWSAALSLKWSLSLSAPAPSMTWFHWLDGKLQTTFCWLSFQDYHSKSGILLVGTMVMGYPDGHKQGYCRECLSRSWQGGQLAYTIQGDCISPGKKDQK